MLDRFVYGRVERTSPEAPVPILRTDHDDHMLGGAGNVVRNLVSLGAQATLLSVIGDDEVGRRLTGMVGREERVEPHLLVERPALHREDPLRCRRPAAPAHGFGDDRSDLAALRREPARSRPGCLRRLRRGRALRLRQGRADSRPGGAVDRGGPERRPARGG